MNIFRRIREKLVQVKEKRVFLVRTGEYELLRAEPVNSWSLTETGRSQARAAGETILERLGGDTVTVLLTIQQPHYVQTVRIISETLGVRAKFSDLDYPPRSYDLDYLDELNEAIVMVVNGSILGVALVSNPGPPVELNELCPPHGSVHELVITYRKSILTGSFQELSRRFV